MKRILIAEDQPSGRYILSFALKEAGFEVLTAEDGADALRLLEENIEAQEGIDMLVTDIDMPNLSGVELIDELQNLELNIPVIVMTAIGTKHLVIDLMRKGISEYIDKPFEPKELIERIKAVLEKEQRSKAKQEAVNKKAAEERAKLLRQVEEYKESFENLRSEVENAVGAYDDLIQIDSENLKVNIAYQQRPLVDLGGDYIDIHNTEDGVDVIIADVAGHDMGASFHTILIKTLFEENEEARLNGNDFFKRLNTVLFDKGRNERMVTACFLKLNLKEMKGELYSAGHPHPVKIENKFPVPRPIYAGGDVLGLYGEVNYDRHFFELTPGMRILLHTDGLIDVYSYDVESGRKQKFTEDMLDELISKYYDMSIEDMIGNIWEDILSYSKYKYKDDMTLLGIEIPEN